MNKIQVDLSKTYLSSRFCAYKTEAFIRQTRKASEIDRFVSHVFEGILAASLSLPADKAVMAETFDRSFTLFFTFIARPYGGDYVFYKFLSREKIERNNDRQLVNYLERNAQFSVTLREVDDTIPTGDFSKLYLLSGDDKVNFPLLNAEQRALVETEDKNVLAQGVAGSGKTNICIEKIVYSACRGYRGRILYTTFSRGLLIETKNRVSVIRENMDKFVRDYENGRVVFLDKNHKKAVENRLGILFAFDDDAYVIDVLKRVSVFLREQVDYFLIEDLYFARFPRGRVFTEKDFVREYRPAAASRLGGQFERLKNLSPEIVYKEVYGMIFGKYEPDESAEIVSKDDYILLRKDSFSRAECEAIHAVAVDYKKYLDKNGYLDNNLMSRRILSSDPLPAYSVGIADETQDFTQVNLCLLKKLCIKLFCVGDALQMINPSYFSFGYLKRLLYGEITGVTTLRHNYRNAEKIEKIVEKIGELNVGKFGVHNFVLKGRTVRSGIDASAVYVSGNDFPRLLGEKRFENLTVIVSTAERKEALRKTLGKTEILTVSEAKGLERSAVVLLDVLSDDADKWRALQSATLNRKTADENSVYRYYFNLFYVGVSRAKQYLLVSEREENDIFAPLFSECFERKNEKDAIAFLTEIAGKTELDDDELIDRIEKFIELGQYENAYFTSDRLGDDLLRNEERTKIYVAENFVSKGDFRGAGVEYWRRGLDDDAKKMFRVSGDEKVIPLIDACREGGKNLDYEIVKFFPIVQDNPVAVRIVIDTLKNDYQQLMGAQTHIKEALKAKRSKK